MAVQEILVRDPVAVVYEPAAIGGAQLSDVGKEGRIDLWRIILAMIGPDGMSHENHVDVVLPAAGQQPTSAKKPAMTNGRVMASSFVFQARTPDTVASEYQRYFLRSSLR